MVSPLSRFRPTAAAALAVVGTLVTGVVAAPAAAAAGGTATVTVQIRPASPHVGDMLHVSGTVIDTTSKSPEAMQPVSIQRTDSAGAAAAVPAMTDANGAYSYDDPTPAVRGALTYTVTWMTVNQTSEGHASVTVQRKPTSLTISADKSFKAAGQTVHLTAHLASPTTDSKVTIYAIPYKRSRVVVASGDVDPTDRTLSTSYRMMRRTRFVAHFGGDDTYAPADTHVIVRAHATVEERLRGGYATDGAYRIYHASGSPLLAAHMLPELNGVCLTFNAERYHDGGWHRIATGCVHTDAQGRAVGSLTGNHYLHSAYRVRASWGGTFAVAAWHGKWLKLRFT